MTILATILVLFVVLVLISTVGPRSVPAPFWQILDAVIVVILIVETLRYVRVA